MSYPLNPPLASSRWPEQPQQPGWGSPQPTYPPSYPPTHPPTQPGYGGPPVGPPGAPPPPPGWGSQPPGSGEPPVSQKKSNPWPSLLFGTAVAVLLIGGLVWFLFLQEEDDGVTVASDDLTADMVASILLTSNELGEGFGEGYRGEARGSSAEVDGSPECEAGYAALQALESEFEAVFQDPNGAALAQLVGRVRSDDPDIDSVVSGLGACASDVTLVLGGAAQATGSVTAERIDDLGEAALAVLFTGDSPELGATLEVYTVLWAHGGLYSRVTVQNALVDQQGNLAVQGTADRNLAHQVAEAADQKIQLGIE